MQSVLNICGNKMKSTLKLCCIFATIGKILGEISRSIICRKGPSVRWVILPDQPTSKP